MKRITNTSLNVSLLIRHILLLTLCIVSPTISAPFIQIDTSDINAGLIRLGSTDEVRHTFTVKNTGDEILRIHKVNASCGCTVVEYDSIVPVGQTGKIVQVVKTQNMHAGTTTKSIRVTSNAKNSDLIRLSITFKLVDYINVTPQYISITIDNGKAKGALQFTTEKKDIKIKSFTFKPQHSTSPSWQNDVATNSDITFSTNDSLNADGFFGFTLKYAFTIDPLQPLAGDFYLQTDHPKKSEIKIPGILLPAENKKK